jgi:hypothetical protein
MKTAQEYADIILAEIHHDMNTPFPWGGTIPRDVGSFSRLHDFVDANMYVADAVDADWEADHPGVDPYDEDDSIRRSGDQQYADLVNEVTGIVDRRLAAEASPDWCRTCGNPVQEGRCGCWGRVAQAFEQYLGTDFDTAANTAAQMWERLEIADRLRVWHADYAQDHFTWKDGKQVPVEVYEKQENHG